jgi:hypothetical protein
MDPPGSDPWWPDLGGTARPASTDVVDTERAGDDVVRDVVVDVGCVDTHPQ